MLNVLVQLFTLIYGLMINFLLPATYGLAIYGEFIALNAMVFLVHRSMTIISEPLIRFTSAETLIYSSLALNGIVFLAFTFLNAVLPIGSPLLLFGMLLSSSVLLSLQALRLRRAYVGFLLAACGLFLVLLVSSYLNNLSIPLVRLMEVSATIPAVLWLIFVLQQSAIAPRGAELVETLKLLVKQVPQMLSITAVMNLYMSALPVFLARTLVPYDLGLFKVMTSVIQSATSVFPVSTQALLSSFVRHKHGVQLYRLLVSVATLYFAAATAALVLLAMVIPKAAPYVALAACLPVFYRAILTERHFTATHRIKPLMVINLSIAVATMLVLPHINTVEMAAVLYAAGFSAYALALVMSDPEGRPPLLTPVLMVLAPLAVDLMRYHAWIGLFYAGLIVVGELIRQPPSRAELKLLWRDL